MGVSESLGYNGTLKIVLFIVNLTFIVFFNASFFIIFSFFTIFVHLVRASSITSF